MNYQVNKIEVEYRSQPIYFIAHRVDGIKFVYLIINLSDKYLLTFTRLILY